MKNLLRYSIVICLISAASGCASPDDNKAGSGSSSSTTPPGAPTASEAEPLIIKISTKYDKTETYYEHKFVETGTTTCSTTAGTPHKTCTIEVPEGRLYYSSVRFSFSWRNDKCKLLTFEPYYYVANTASATYPAPWGPDDGVDCTKGLFKNDPMCFGGAAPYLIEEFPKYKSEIYLSDPTTSTPVTAEKLLPSANSKHYYSNRLSSNDLDPAKVGTGFDETDLGVAGDNYIAGSMKTYKWSCQDDWYDPVTYELQLIIKDVDSDNGGVINDFLTWKEVP